MTTVTIGERNIGPGHPTFIVLEAGPTHTGLESAQALAKAARHVGADAIKFQITLPDRLIADEQQTFTFEKLVDRETERRVTVTAPYREVVRQRAMPFDDWRALKAYCDALGLSFFATAAFPDVIDFLVKIGCYTVKIASGDVNHYPLLRYAARSGMIVQLDTGNADVPEVLDAVLLLKHEGAKGIIVHHVPSGYPATPDDVHLLELGMLQDSLGLPIGFSDHSPGWTMDIAAVAMGASLVEKTITLDRMTRAPEHCFSLEPDDMKKFVQAIREVDKAMTTKPDPTDKQQQKRLAVRRSVYVVEDTPMGTRLGDVRVEFSRPGYGISPDVYERMLDCQLQRSVQAGEMLTAEDLA